MNINAVTVKIPNWDKYQKKTDKGQNSARHHWFAFENCFFDDHKVSMLDAHEKLVFIYLLCELSKDQRPKDKHLPDEILINLDLVSRSTGATIDAVKVAIQKLDYLQLVKASRPSFGQDSAKDCPSFGPYTTLHNTTLQGELSNDNSLVQSKDRTIEKGSKKPKAKKFQPDQDVLDFIYAEYPRKQRKKQGMERMRRIAKNQEMLDRMSAAVSNYAFYCEETKRPTRYQKLFDSFWSIWEDWTDFEMTQDRIKAELSDNKSQKRSY